MEATKKRQIRPGKEYDSLFPLSEGNNKTIRKNANVEHTVDFISKVVHETLNQTEAISRKLKGRSVYESCSNIWHFVYQHINYKKDQEGYEQIRSPARSWKDRYSGVDCDCYSTFISSILVNLGIPHKLRITKYWKSYFQHIYPVVQNGSREIIIDCVTDKFDYEVPYSEKKDYPMDLQYLNGFDGDDMEELGKLIKRNIAKKSPTLSKAAKKATPGLIKKIKSKVAAKSNPTNSGASGSSVPTTKKKNKGVLKKIASKINKVNPATVLLRNGVLASMKLNVKNVAARLRWSYLTPEQAASKGMLPDKYQKLVATRQKLENIFSVAGGKVDNLKKAILGGKGNKDKAVSGLGMLPMVEYSAYMNGYTPLDQLLGPETYYSENIEGIRGFGQLGEPVTLTSIAAAAGVLAGIVSALKQIGDVFGGKKQESSDFDEAKTDAPENSVDTSKVTPSEQLPVGVKDPILPESSTPENYSERSSDDVVNSSAITTSTQSDEPEDLDEPSESAITTTTNTAVTNTSDSNIDSTPTPDKQSFWDKNKSWLKPVAIGAGGLAVIAIGFNLMKSEKGPHKSSQSRSLSGVPGRKKKKPGRKKHHNRKTNHRSRKKKHQHKIAIALL